MNGQENLEGKLLRKKKPDLGEKCGKVIARAIFEVCDLTFPALEREPCVGIGNVE